MRARPNSAALKKRKRFLGRPNFAHARALCETPSCPAYFNTSLFSARGLMPAGLRKYAFSYLNKNDSIFIPYRFRGALGCTSHTPLK
jgi:hypothetical protein